MAELDAQFPVVYRNAAFDDVNVDAKPAPTGPDA
jgi:hypothetical protein